MTNPTNDLQGLSNMMQQAIAYIWAEADMLDKKNYLEWESLWTENGTYVIPIDPDTTDFASQLNYVYDDARMRRLRIERLTSGFSASAADAANTVRTVSRFFKTAETDDMIEINSAQVIVGFKRGKHTLFAANLTHKIRFIDGIPKLEQKVIRLINSEDSLDAIGFLL
jgi:3-phenylpropionate/cinnamic acid dioxygenase small subunit